MNTIQKPCVLFLGNAQQREDAKLATALADWRPQECVAQTSLSDCRITIPDLPVLDFKKASELGAKTLVIGTAGPGGRMDNAFRPIILEAIDNKFNIAAGMHDFLQDDLEIATAAAEMGVDLYDLRKPPSKLPIGSGKLRTGKRLMTIGTDCSVGKMYTTLALEKAMQRRGISAEFVATGQTGILIGGSGIAVDAVTSDFIAGAAEQLSPDADADHWYVIEGQATVCHPSYSGVTIGLIHGSQPDAFVLCHNPTREHMLRKPDIPMPSIQETIDAHTAAAQFTHPHKQPQIVGISCNTSAMSNDKATDCMKKIEDEHQLPCIDPVRNGVGAIVDRIEARAFEIV